MPYRLIHVTTDGEGRDYHDLRRSVLWEARGDLTYDDKHPDEYLPANHPLLLTWNGRSIGTTRLDVQDSESGIVRLVAIAADLQRQGHGRELQMRVEDYARRLGLTTLYVNAAPEALGFYQKLGWILFDWDKSELTGIAANCIQMKKSIKGTAL